MKKHLPVAIYNLLVASRSQNTAVITPLGNNPFTIPAHFKASPGGLGKAFCLLTREGFATQEKGFKGSGFLTGLPTITFPNTERLLSHLNLDRTHIESDPKSDCLILKDVKKRPIKIKSKKKAAPYRKATEELQKRMRTHKWTYQDSEGITHIIPNEALKVKRVFNNGSFNQGGRFYFPAQNIEKGCRKTILIDGYPTEELDFVAMHLHMAYHLEGKQYQGEDPYCIPDYEDHRELIKTIAQCCLNCENLGQVKRAVREYHPKAKHVSEAVEAFLAQHKTINLLNHDGLALQHLDSKVVTQILSLTDVPFLPIHDSFIIPSHQQGEFLEAMVLAYVLVMKSSSPYTTKDSSAVIRRERDRKVLYPAAQGIKVINNVMSAGSTVVSTVDASGATVSRTAGYVQ
ncbi:hypothetical protein [Microbulbifer sp. VAAF005]|uniref:hypothetical protein n=1 Tax=Microbulbifer sp. VAAF005 TaxID=3034230 RepID=UPI0024AD6237|nr:hypothetical protein [Microbulbifer sp. VAAF005]WHI45684.1 hypothetical protein P0078_18435 [Microbulbifer sp. VAAF005]